MATRDDATGTALKLWLTLVRAHASLSRLSNADIAQHGFSPSEFSILEVLFHKGPLLLGDLQRKVLVSSGGITFLVDRLAARGLVERQECPSDRRARFAALTRDGQALMKRIFPPHADAMLRAVSGLSAAEQRTATALLRKLGLAAAEFAAQAPEFNAGADPAEDERADLPAARPAARGRRVRS